MRAPYKAKSLSGAQKRVRQLEKLLATASGLLERYAKERWLLARLAEKNPQFDNPLIAWEAERIRDEILKGPARAN